MLNLQKRLKTLKNACLKFFDGLHQFLYFHEHFRWFLYRCFYFFNKFFKFCYLYETTGYGVKEEEAEVEVPSRLSLNFREITRIITDTNAKDAYQVCKV